MGVFRRYQGAAIGHISPEAMEKGPLAIVEGDIIEIDIPGQFSKLDLKTKWESARLS